jgi:resolvase-like protein/helix-turn-helix resolvase-like protein
MITGGNWWRANEIVMHHLTRQTDARYRSRDKADRGAQGGGLRRHQDREAKRLIDCGVRRAEDAARLHPRCDVLTVTRIDRLARSIGDLQDIVRELKAKGAILKATEQPIDASIAAGKAFLDMLGVFAEFETNLRRERQMEGIAAAKLRGVYKGRPPSIDAAKVAALKAEGLGATEIAKRLKVGRASVYRVLAARGKRPGIAPGPSPRLVG